MVRTLPKLPHEQPQLLRISKTLSCIIKTELALNQLCFLYYIGQCLHVQNSLKGYLNLVLQMLLRILQGNIESLLPG